MDTAKLEKQVKDAGRVNTVAGWVQLVVTVLIVVLFGLKKDYGTAAINLVLMGSLGVWAVVAGKRASSQAAAQDLAGYRKTLTRFTWALLIYGVLFLVLGGRVGILMALLVFWNTRAISASKKLEAGGTPSAPGATPLISPTPTPVTPETTMPENPPLLNPTPMPDAPEPVQPPSTPVPPA